MDPFLILGIMLLAGAAGYQLCRAQYEPVIQELRERVHEMQDELEELEKDQQPKIEAKILERMYRK